MPDNPSAASLVVHAARALDAQRKLREAMAALAAEHAATPPPAQPPAPAS